MSDAMGYVGVGDVEQVVVDCRSPFSLADFWCRLVGGTVDQTRSDPDWVRVVNVRGLGVLAFQRVPERKHTKNRLHLDVAVADVGAATAQAVQLGATVSGKVVHDGTGTFQVMLDPEGHEFCLVNNPVSP